MLKGALFFILAFLNAPAFADYRYNMPVGVTPLSRDIFELHMIAFWVCVAIGVVTFGVLFYALIMHRKSRGVKAADFHEHPVLEIVWAIVPFLILIALAIPATKLLIKSHNTREADITIKITGYQWKWQYEYLDYGISFFSNLSTPLDERQNKADKGPHYLLEVDKPLVLPVHKKIRFLITANDVLHAWWVPDLGIKVDSIPGFVRESWAEIDTEGTYRGQCAELCGAGHGFMPIVVEAVSEDEFNDWVAHQGKAKLKTKVVSKKAWTQAELLAQGKPVYEGHCAVCHQLDGRGQAPVYPALIKSPVSVGPVAENIKIVLRGVPGTAMQGFANQLSNEDIAAVITYQRHTFGDLKEEAVQPKEVAALK